MSKGCLYTWGNKMSTDKNSTIGASNKRNSDDRSFNLK